jgi:hypothetical protein
MSSIPTTATSSGIRTSIDFKYFETPVAIMSLSQTIPRTLRLAMSFLSLRSGSIPRREEIDAAVIF